MTNSGSEINMSEWSRLLTLFITELNKVIYAIFFQNYFLNIIKRSILKQAGKLF